MTKLFRVVAIFITSLLVGCSHIDPHDPRYAGLADAVTTEVGLAHGARELNPLGATGAYLVKGYYLFVYRSGLGLEERREMDRRLSSLWWAASVSNFLQITAPTLGLGTFLIGGLVGWEIYIYPQSSEVSSR